MYKKTDLRSVLFRRTGCTNSRWFSLSSTESQYTCLCLRCVSVYWFNEKEQTYNPTRRSARSRLLSFIDSLFAVYLYEFDAGQEGGGWKKDERIRGYHSTARLGSRAQFTTAILLLQPSFHIKAFSCKLRHGIWTLGSRLRGGGAPIAHRDELGIPIQVCISTFLPRGSNGRRTFRATEFPSDRRLTLKARALYCAFSLRRSSADGTDVLRV